MTTVSVSVDLDASQQQTWAAITDWVRQGEWMPLTHVEVLDGPPQGLSTRLSARTGLGPASFVDPMTIDVWQPPHRCEVQHHGRVVVGRGVFLVDPLPGGRSRFTWQEVLTGGPVQRVVNAVTAPATRLVLGYAVRRFASQVESASP